MLAYVFWHQPNPPIEQKAYEASIVRFQADLAREPPPGFISASSFAISAVPWLPGERTYEDWSLLEGSWAMDPLNAYAVTGARQAAHDHVAAQAGESCGGLYAHAGGEVFQAPQSTVYWLTRPRGIQWQAAIAPIRAKCPQAVVWRRQMVLAPATEFAVEVPGDTAIEVPSGWQMVCRVTRRQLAR